MFCLHAVCFVQNSSVLTNRTRPPEMAKGPNDSDVLFGRGNLAKFHPGNFHFRKLVAQAQPTWSATKHKEDRL